MDISIVIPAHNEEDNLVPLGDLLVQVMTPLGMIWEVIIVDDFSADRTYRVANSLKDKISNVQCLRLTRNFGHQAALLAGLSKASGRAVITMDADLQHPPVLIPQMIKLWKEGYYVVNSKRNDSVNSGSLVKRATSLAFYKFISLMSQISLEPGTADFRLMDQQVVSELMKMSSPNFFLRGAIAWLGFKTAHLEYVPDMG